MNRYTLFNLNIKTQIETTVLQSISTDQAYSYKIVPFKLEENTIYFYSLTTDKIFINELEIILGLNIKLHKINEEELNKLLYKNYRKQNSTHTTELHYSNDFLENLLQKAKSLGSSDIHFEPYEFKCRIRLRIDGKLIEQFLIDKNEYPTIVNKIKIKAGLDISEKRLPQDGRITVNTHTENFDIRTSTLPTLHGEKIVLRILSKDANHIELSNLGFDHTELKTYLESLKKPNGIILISGPTGSGKTTTLYATLKKLNSPDTNVLTIEDPIEYTLEGVNQVQLKETIGLDFASTLKTFLRQDPDVIMVGEIRDSKTANMAIRAALTGHLVLSTIHTNSAWATVSRLVDMNIPSFLIANTLNVSIAQRLVRKLCKNCKNEEELTNDKLPTNFIKPNYLKNHFKANGCEICHYTGYSGRQAIYEIIPITKHLVEAIRNNDLEVDNYLKEHDIATLKDNALKLIKEGTTSVDEVYALLID